ncbi:MAG: CvpA family protein [Actinomycetota bacterium]
MCGFNLIDLFIAAFLVLWVLHGYRRGFLVSIVDLLLFFLSIYLAFKTYPFLSAYANNTFGLSKSLANLFSFALSFSLAHLILNMISIRFIHPHISKILIGHHAVKFDRIAGILPTAIGGLVWLFILLGMFCWFPISNYIKTQITESAIGSQIVKIAAVVEPEVEQIAGRAVVDTIGFVTTTKDKEDETPWKPNIPTDTKTQFDQAAEAYMLRLINRERGMRGLGLLVLDLDLRKVARDHSLDMVENNYFDHVSPSAGALDDRLEAGDVFYLMAGENIAYALDIDLAHNGLMGSPGHRANILEPNYGRVGIGIVKAGPYGYMCTQDFAN